jgi:hypothetical protein
MLVSAHYQSCSTRMEYTSAVAHACDVLVSLRHLLSAHDCNHFRVQLSYGSASCGRVHFDCGLPEHVSLSGHPLYCIQEVQ